MSGCLEWMATDAGRHAAEAAEAVEQALHALG